MPTELNLTLSTDTQTDFKRTITLREAGDLASLVHLYGNIYYDPYTGRYVELGELIQPVVNVINK